MCACAVATTARDAPRRLLDRAASYGAGGAAPGAGSPVAGRAPECPAGPARRDVARMAAHHHGASSTGRAGRYVSAADAGAVVGGRIVAAAATVGAPHETARSAAGGQRDQAEDVGGATGSPGGHATHGTGRCRRVQLAVVPPTARET